MSTSFGTDLETCVHFLWNRFKSREVHLKPTGLRDLAAFAEFNENRGWSQEGRAWAAVGECGLYLMFTKECQWQGVAQRSVHFQVTHSGVYCPASQLNDVMFHLRLLVMLKSVVCTPGGKRQGESCQSGFCKAFVCWVLRDKSWLMQYFCERSCTD